MHHGQPSQFHPEVVWWERFLQQQQQFFNFTFYKDEMEWHCCDKSLMKTNASRSHTLYHTSQGNNTSIHTHIFVKCNLCKIIVVLSLKRHLQNSVSEHPEDHESSIKTFRCKFYWILVLGCLEHISPVACWMMGQCFKSVIPYSSSIFFGGNEKKTFAHFGAQTQHSCPF